MTPTKYDRNFDLGLLRSEVEAAINKVKPHKSPGSDGICGEILQTGGEELTDQVHLLYVETWETETQPEEWTKCIIVAGPKKGHYL